MKITAFCLCWLLILTAPGVMARQPTTPNQSSTVPNQSPTAPNQSWELLRQLQAGEDIEVERKTGKKKASGDFVSLSDTELVIRRGFRDESLSRDEVKNIWRIKKPGFGKRVLFGAIGGGLALLSVAGAVRAFNVGEKYIIVVALITLAAIPIGAVMVSYLVSRKMTKRILIYSAP
jgi:hypothetical protein